MMEKGYWLEKNESILNMKYRNPSLLWWRGGVASHHY